MTYTIEEFFLLFSNYKKEVMIFIFQDWKYLKQPAVEKLRNGQTFMVYGVEYVKTNDHIHMVRG